VDQGDDNLLESISHQFCNDLSDAVYQRYRSKVINNSGGVDLRDQGDKSIINWMNDNIVIKEIKS
jgi:hypothetical protein